MYIVCVNVLSGDHPKHVRGLRKGALASARPRSRSVEGGDGAGRTPHEAVIHAVRVNVLSCDFPQQVDALRYGALAGTCSRVRNVEGSDAAEYFRFSPDSGTTVSWQTGNPD